MADYVRVYPVDTSAGSTETNSTAWVKNELEHDRLYRVISSSNAQMERALSDMNGMLSDYDDILDDFKKQMQDTLNSINSTVSGLNKGLEAKLDKIQSQVDDLKNKLAALSGGSGDTASSLANLSATVANLEAWASHRTSYTVSTGLVSDGYRRTINYTYTDARQSGASYQNNNGS